MAIYKRGQVWWMNFQFNGKRIQESTKCKNKRDAETVERAYRTQLAKGEVGIIDKPDAPNFEMAMKDYLAWAEVEHAKKPNTLRSYKSTSRALCAFFAQTKIDEIGSGDVEKFKQWRSKQKCQPRSEVKSTKKSDKKKPKTKLSTLKPATINRELALLKIVFNYFIKKDILLKNAVSSVKFFSEDNQQTRVVSNEEEKVYLMAASQPLQDFATVMIDTGMRPEEVSHIERKNIFLDEGYLFIPFGKTKAAKRKIPLTSRVREILEKRLDNIEVQPSIYHRINGKTAYNAQNSAWKCDQTK